MKSNNVGENIKGYWFKWMEAVGNTASDVANNTRYKVEEAKLLSKRQSIMDRLGETAYVLWQQGESFPAKLDEMLKDLDDANGKLNTLHSEHLAWIKTKEKSADNGDKAVEDKAASDSVQTEEKDQEPPVEEIVREAGSAVEAAVEAVHNAGEAIVAEIPEAGPDNSSGEPQKPLAEEMNVKLDNMIDQIGSGLKKLGTEIDQGLNRLSDRLIGPQKPQDAQKNDSAENDAKGSSSGGAGGAD